MSELAHLERIIDMGRSHGFSVGATLGILLLALWSGAPAESVLDIETGVAFSGYNDVRIPGDTGTEFSLSQELEADPTAFVRARGLHTFGEKHTVWALVAPLRIRSEGTIDREVLFEDETFDPGTSLKTLYRFDSYRLSYRYDFHRRERFRAGVGLTAKIRDASVRVESAGKRAEKTNTGFVPLVTFLAEWRPSKRLRLILEGDALAGPQGRAEDVLLALRYSLGERVGVKLGYRLLEGGADVDEVYNFTLVNYVALGILLKL